MPDELVVAGDALVVGGGRAGMSTAVTAARNGASVVPLDKNVIGRGGVFAQGAVLMDSPVIGRAP